MTRKNGEELYYRFDVRGWEKLGKPIQPKEKGFLLEYTNLFLLQHSEFVPELRLEDEDQYRFCSELKRHVNSAVINEDDANIGFEYGDIRYVFFKGEILVLKDEQMIDRALIADFSRKPGEVFRRLKR